MAVRAKRDRKRDTGINAMPRPKGKALDSELAVTTKEAARLLGRRPQTLRKWACYGVGPIEPIRGHTRLLWSLREIEKLRRFQNAERQKAKQQRSGAS
jgi:hypothetical protein